jgi:hypothetical protein
VRRFGANMEQEGVCIQNSKALSVLFFSAFDLRHGVWNVFERQPVGLIGLGLV